MWFISREMWAARVAGVTLEGILYWKEHGTSFPFPHPLVSSVDKERKLWWTRGKGRALMMGEQQNRNCPVLWRFAELNCDTRWDVMWESNRQVSILWCLALQLKPCFTWVSVTSTKMNVLTNNLNKLFYKVWRVKIWSHIFMPHLWHGGVYCVWAQ